MIINDPETLAALSAAFGRYEQALVRNDLRMLDALFWNSERTVRYGVGENLYGFTAIREFRVHRPTYGTDFGTANTEFVRENSTLIGRQSQSWVRMAEGWRVVAAHVSMMAGFS
jgi:serine/threonine protein kinase HipA of HipAB toxin-antitoxin module